jgi:hypothetical protein
LELTGQAQTRANQLKDQHSQDCFPTCGLITCGTEKVISSQPNEFPNIAFACPHLLHLQRKYENQFTIYHCFCNYCPIKIYSSFKSEHKRQENKRVVKIRSAET